MKAIILIGRILFSFIFLQSVIFHFTPGAISYAGSAGVPYPSIVVPLSGVMACAGAISIILGFKAKVGAWLIILFLIPVTFYMHAFWKIADPVQAQVQTAMFMKNLSMLGGAFILAYFGSGPLSLDRPQPEYRQTELRKKEVKAQTYNPV